MIASILRDHVLVGEVTFLYKMSFATEEDSMLCDDDFLSGSFSLQNNMTRTQGNTCLLYTSDAADE